VPSEAALAAFDRTRNLSDKAIRSLCYAPFTSLYFDVRGDVRVCCHNSKYPVGNILHEGIDHIWRGDRIRTLRRELAGYRFGPGCNFCEFQTAEGCMTNVAMRKFDEFAVDAENPPWPRQMEFSISNVCNLECIMCRGQWSSAIRSRREKLPPLPKLLLGRVSEIVAQILAASEARQIPRRRALSGRGIFPSLANDAR